MMDGSAGFGYLPICQKPGRKGDPRMHRALQARIRNPKLTLFAALCQGGFIFFPRPGVDSDTATEASLCDSEGILLCQRKNQLSRRIRSIRDKTVDVSSDIQDGGECSDADTTIALPPKRKAGKSAHGSTSHRAKRVTAHTCHEQTRQNQEQVKESISAPFSGVIDYDTTATKSSVQLKSLCNADVLNNPEDNESRFHSIRNAAISSLLNMDGNLLVNARHSNLHHTQLSSSSRPQEVVNNSVSAPNKESAPGFYIADQNRLRSAFDNYRIESGFLFKKCMVLAGYQIKQTDETDVAYLSFLEAIVNYEKQRLLQLATIAGVAKEAGLSSNNSYASAVTTSDLDSNGIREIIEAVPTSTHDMNNTASRNLGDLAPWATNRDSCKSSHDHSLCRSHAVIESESLNRSKCKLKKRHLHRLEGKCGHKPVIHKPDGGAPHVDFIVDGKIECYSGVKPTKTDEAMWPSRYNCDEIKCPEAGCHENYFHLKNIHSNNCVFGNEPEAPILLDISDIDKNSKEWNIDFFNSSDENSLDSTLLGLFQLGDARSS